MLAREFMMITKPTVVEVKELMKNENKIILQHAGKDYQLSITRRRKLILTLAEPSNTKV